MNKISTLIRAILLFIISLSCMGGCVEEEHAQRMANQARMEALASSEAECRTRVENAKTWAFNKGYAEATKKAGAHLSEVIRQANDSLLAATEMAFADGRKDALKKVSVAKFQIALPTAIGIGSAALIVFLIVMIIERTVLPKIAKYVAIYIRDAKWSVRSQYGQTQKVKVEQEKWNAQEELVQKKNGKLIEESATIKSQNDEYRQFIEKGMPAHQENMARQYICDGEARLIRMGKLHKIGLNHLKSIGEIKTGLDMALYRIANDPGVSLSEMYNQCDELDRKIRDYVRWDIDEFDAEESYDDYDPFADEEELTEDFADLKNKFYDN